MLLPRQKPSSYSLLKFVYVISQLVVHPLLRIILDPPPATSKSKTKFPSAAPSYWQHCSALIYLFVILFFSLGRKQMGHGVTLAGAFGRQRVALNELSQDEH